MIKYSKLKEKIMDDVIGVAKDDFFLLEGKLIFKSREKCLIVKRFLERKYAAKLIVINAVNHNHWNTKYESEMYFEDLAFGIED